MSALDDSVYATVPHDVPDEVLTKAVDDLGGTLLITAEGRTVKLTRKHKLKDFEIADAQLYIAHLKDTLKLIIKTVRPIFFEDKLTKQQLRKLKLDIGALIVETAKRIGSKEYNSLELQMSPVMQKDESGEYGVYAAPSMAKRSFRSRRKKL